MSRLLLLSLLLVACSAPPAEDIRLGAPFTDHMVLQRDAPLAIWGWATPGGAVAVTLGSAAGQAVADADGRWDVSLPALSSGGPHTLTVSGADSVSLTDVLVGEVWVASGQSNMEWPLSATLGGEADIAAAGDPELRIFTVNRTPAYTPQDTVATSGWLTVTPETIPGFSAVAFHFGRKLRSALGVPVGLVHTSWGGTPAEAWTSAQTLLEMPDFAETVEEIQSMAAAQDRPSFADRQQAWVDAVEALDRGHQDGTALWSNPSLDDASWPTMSLPGLWESQGLPAFDGVVWFRRTVTLPAGWQGGDLSLNLGMIDDNDTAWLNGQEVGRTVGYNTHRQYRIDAGAWSPGENVLTVRVMDTGGGGGVWGEADSMYVTNGTNRLPLGGQWRYQTGRSPETDLPPRPTQAQHTPTTLFNGMIAPLIPLSIRGALWYQGESNAGRAYQYRSLFPAMIEDWRAHWDQGDFPFLFVQLANFMAPQSAPAEAETWPELREAQHMALALPHTGEAVTIDIGEADDIHPRNKRDVGLRLALWALGTVYGQDIVYAGPTYRNMDVQGSLVLLHFDHVGGGLVAQGGEPLGFAIAGQDRVFHWADAQIVGEMVEVSSPAVPNPVAVRYAWANNPVISLYNAEGLPASPFRTDDWPGVTHPTP